MPAMPFYQVFNGSTAGGTAVLLDWTVPEFKVSFALELLAGTGTFGVQYTLDNVNASNPTGSAYIGDTFSSAGTTTVTWFPDANVGTTGTVSTTGNYFFPVQALRCIIGTSFANSTGNFSLQFVVLQGCLPY